MNKTHVEKYEECEHKRNDEIASDCIHCHVAWCHARIEYLEKELKHE